MLVKVAAPKMISTGIHKSQKVIAEVKNPVLPHGALKVEF